MYIFYLRIDFYFSNKKYVKIFISRIKNMSDVSADSIFQKYQKQRDDIVEKLKNQNLKKWEDLDLKYDRHCRFNLGSYSETLKTDIICQGCKEIGLLVDLTDENIIGKPFDIKYGEFEGRSLVVEMEKDVIPKLQYQENISSNLEYLFKYFTEFQACDSSLSLDTKFLALDQFTNKVLINYVLGEIIPENIVMIENAFICGKDGFLVSEVPGIGGIGGLFQFPEFFVQKYFSGSVIRGVLVQLCDILGKLGEYNFCHNNGIMDSLRFEYTEDGLLVQLSGLEYASLNVGGLRIYNKSGISSLYIKDVPFIPDIKINQSIYKKECGKKNGEGNTYKVNTESAKQILQLRRLGIPIFNTSFDLYCFLISLCVQPEFYQGIMSDLGLRGIFESIWTPKDYKIITERLKVKHLEENYNLEIERIVEIFSGVTLRCGFLEYLRGIL